MNLGRLSGGRSQHSKLKGIKEPLIGNKKNGDKVSETREADEPVELDHNDPGCLVRFFDSVIGCFRRKESPQQKVSHNPIHEQIMLRELQIEPIQAPEIQVASVLEAQRSIFSKADFTEEDRSLLNQSQKKFEHVITALIQEGSPIPHIPVGQQNVFAEVVRGDGAIRFSPGFPENIKDHLLCTIARLMMCDTGAQLVEVILRSADKIVEFRIGDSEPGMGTAPENERYARVKDTRYSDSESERSSDPNISSPNSEGSIGEKPVEDIIGSIRELVFRNNELYQRIPGFMRRSEATYESWDRVDNSSEYPLKANSGSGSLVMVNGYMQDGAITVGGEDATGNLKRILSPAFMVLGHELIHALHNQLGVNLRDVQRDIFDTRLPNSFSTLEEFETITGHHFNISENQIRLESGFDPKYGVRTGHKIISM